MRHVVVNQRVCLITPAHLSTNPRLVKEADALTADGYVVKIIAARFMTWPDMADNEFSNRRWEIEKIEYGPLAKPWHRAFLSIRRRICRTLAGWIGPRQGLTERAFHSIVPELINAACATPADIYIAHNLAALPAAYVAAKKNKAKFGFDAEDFHSGELPDTSQNALSITLARDIEQRYLPFCDYVTAASPGIARAYANLYGLALPTVVLNVFPKSDLHGGATARGTASPSPSPSPSLYWFSQTIGPDRGLETVIEALAQAQCQPTLFLRGNPIPEYVEVLNALAAKHGVSDRLCYLPTASAGDMVRLAFEYDVGIASEPGKSNNNNIALSNKLFTYLMAGIPVLASATTAQAEISIDMPGAVFIYNQQDSRSLAKAMDDLLLSSDALKTARQSALMLAKDKYNWDIEKYIYLDQIARVLGKNNLIGRM